MTHCCFVFCPSDESCEGKDQEHTFTLTLLQHVCHVHWFHQLQFCAQKCYSDLGLVWSGTDLWDVCEFPQVSDGTSIGWRFSWSVCRVWRTRFTRWCERSGSTRWGSWTRRTRADRTAWTAAASCRDPGANTDRMNDISHWKPVKIDHKSPTKR